MRALSVSQATAFYTCRWAYRELNIRKRPVARPEPFALGGLIHQAIEHYINHLIATQQEHAGGDVDVVWKALLASGFEGETVQPHQWAETRRVLEKFAGSFRLDLDAVWKAEAELAIDVTGRPRGWWDEDVMVRGKADLVLVNGRSGEVLDWKSAHVPVSEEALKEDLQARTYALLLHANNPLLEEVIITFAFVRFGIRRTARFYRRDFEATLAEWQEIHTSINEELKGKNLFDTKRWKATPGPHCGMCAAASVCPIGEEAIRNVATLTYGDAEQLAERLIGLDAMREALRNKLKEYVKDKGPVETVGFRFDFFPSASYEYNTAQVERIAHQHFVDPALFTKVDTAALAQAIRNNPAMAAQIDQEKARWDVGKVAFSYRKIRGEEA
jgi:hypothetical protein